MKLPAIDRGQLIKFGLLALVPWIWAVLFVPLWVSAIALLLALIVVGFFLQAESTVNAADALAADTEVPDDKNAIRRLLARWSGMSQTSTVELGETQGALQEVIEESETAVLNISKSFRNITSRSTQQIEYAMGLLQTTRGPGDVGSGDSNETEMSLPEYIRAYEVLLNLTIDRLNDFATDCLKVIDSADHPNEDPTQLAALHEKLRQLATENQTDAEQSRSDAVHLSGGMVLKNQQVNDVLKHINTTAQEIRRDVNQLIVAMQFQDITQQKLERLRGPLLSEIIKSLGSISDETRVLSKQLKMGMLPLPSAKNQGSDEAGSENEAAHIEAALETPKPIPLGSKPKPITGPGDENSVELF
jgi:hypothetical protein